MPDPQYEHVTSRVNHKSAWVGLVSALLGLTTGLVAMVGSNSFAEFILQDRVASRKAYDQIVRERNDALARSSALEGRTVEYERTVQSLQEQANAATDRAQECRASAQARERTLIAAVDTQSRRADAAAAQEQACRTKAQARERELEATVEELERKLRDLDRIPKPPPDPTPSGGHVGQFDGIEVAVESVVRKGRALTIGLILTSKGDNRVIRPKLAPAPHPGIRCFDGEGIEYRANAVEVAGTRHEQPNLVMSKTLVADVPTRARIEFSGVPPTCARLSLLEFHYAWGGRGAGWVPFSDLPIPFHN